MVKNTGEFEKDLRLEVSGVNWAKFDRDSITLNSGEEEKVNLVISPNIDTETGEYTIDTKVIAIDESKASSEDSIVISTTTREECYKPEIGIKDKTVIVNYDGSAVVPVIIENKGSYKASYNVDVTGTASNFLKLNPGVITVDPGRAEIVYLYIAPSGQVKNGNYVASISVRLGDSTILDSDTIDISVSESKVPAEEVMEEEEEIPTAERVSVWQRIKNWFSNLFAPIPSNITEAPEFNITEEIPIEPTEEVMEEENVTEEVIEEEIPEENVTIVPEEVTVEEPKELFTESEVETVNANTNDEFTFIVNEEEHKVTIKSISENEVQIVVESDPVIANFKPNETKQIDVDGDGKNDLEVTVERIDPNTGQATLTYKKLGEVMEETTEEVPLENISIIEGNVTVGVTGAQQGFFSLYKWYIIIGLIIAVLIVVFISTKAYKKVIEFFEEEVEEPKKKRRNKKKEEKEVSEEEEEWS